MTASQQPTSPWLRGTVRVLLVGCIALGSGGCGQGDVVENPGGTLPPILSTTTIPASETTIEPFVEVHRLIAGETLRAVAETYNVPLAELIEANRDRLGEDLDNVPIGTEILIPAHRWIVTLPTPSTTVAPGG